MYELCAIIVGVVLRLLLFRMPGAVSWISSRPEIETPLTSWSRRRSADETLTKLSAQGHLPRGWSTLIVQACLVSVFVAISTLLLAVMSYLNQTSPSSVEVVFIVCDVVTALALYLFARKFLQNEMQVQNECKKMLHKEVSKILIRPYHVQIVPTIICALYICNPFSLATCVAKSTITFNNLFLALFLVSAVQGSLWQMTLYVALATYETLYPVQLVLAAGLCAWKYQDESSCLKLCMVKSISLFCLWMAILLGLSCLFESTPSTVLFHYKFILSAPDQTPNIGLFWYFFTEVFGHFHTFFMCVFQINAIIYSIPMSIKFRSHPVFLVFLLMAITGIFKSYPSIGDAAFWLCLLPLWSHTYPYLRHPSVTGAMLLTSTILCPVMWHMWINAHSANANFYFAATLAYSTALVLITTDTAMAYLNWHHRIRDGLKPCMPGTTEKAVMRLLN